MAENKTIEGNTEAAETAKTAEAVETTESAEAAEAVETTESAEAVEATESAETAESMSAEDKRLARISQADGNMGGGAQEIKSLSRKEQKLIDKKNKEILKKYHVSNWQILKNYRSYSPSEKKHYRYIFGRRVSEAVWPVFRYILLFGLAFVVMYPILYMVSASIRPQAETRDPSIMWIPKSIRLENFAETWRAMEYPSTLANTLFINVGCSILQVITCSIAGYGFARFKFKGKNALFSIVIFQMIVPVQIILIPLFIQFRYFDIFGIFKLINGEALNLVDNPIALFMQAICCNGIRAGLFILLFRQFFRGLPKELEDAAHLDGCGPISTFVRIMIPNSLTSYLTVFIFSVVWYWNDSYVSGMFFNNSKTISLAIDNLWRNVAITLSNSTAIQGNAQDYIVWVEAGCLLAILPILIMYIFLQKYFVEGVERSGIVG